MIEYEKITDDYHGTRMDLNESSLESTIIECHKRKQQLYQLVVSSKDADVAKKLFVPNLIFSKIIPKGFDKNSSLKEYDWHLKTIKVYSDY